MPDPNTLSGRLSLMTDVSDWLAETFRRNREQFGGWRMEADPSDPPPADPPADPPPSDPPADPPKPPWGDDANFKPEQAWELIQNLRKEKGDPNKVAELEGKLAELQSAQQGQLDTIAKALGLKSDDTPPDPAKLAEQITAAQSETATERARADAAVLELAVFKAAAAHDADPLALTDSTTFMSSLKEVDHADAAALGEAIKKAVADNPRFKATPATPPFPGGPRPPAPTQAGTLGEAISKRVAGTR